MKPTFLAVLMTSLIAFAPAYAGSCGGGNHVHSPQEMATKYFDQIDVNSDEIITKAEFEASSMTKMIKSFDVLQPDENGRVTKPDFIEAFVKAHPAPRNEV